VEFGRLIKTIMNQNQTLKVASNLEGLIEGEHMTLNADLLQVFEHTTPGYKPVVVFGAWRVAMLNGAEDGRWPDAPVKMQRHDLTDEIFVLLNGRCLLFLAEGNESVGTIHAVDMQPGKVYNVRRGCWHAHSLASNTQVLIVENDDTALSNSPFADLTPAQTAELDALTTATWQKNPGS
jgi:hypothetical protein